MAKAIFVKSSSDRKEASGGGTPNGDIRQGIHVPLYGALNLKKL